MDVEAILHKLEDEQLIRLNRPIGDWYSIYCPIHNDGSEKKPSCGVLLHDQYRNGRLTKASWVHCFSCNWSKPLSDTITEILKRKNISKSGLDWLKENIPDFDGEVGEFDYLIELLLFVNDFFPCLLISAPMVFYLSFECFIL